MNMNRKNMKTPRFLAACLLALAITTAWGGQPAPTPPPHPIEPPPPSGSSEKRGLTKFDLDFSGGSPRDLVVTIQSAMGQPLNALVAEEFNNVKLPPLKMRNVDVAELFRAIEAASLKNETITTGTYYGGGAYGGYKSLQSVQTGYGFKTDGPVSDDSIWYFYVHKAPTEAGSLVKICRFYSLAPYLEQGLTVDDITTAVETGWKMLGETSQPAVSFHKDTKLLIAVGEPSKLETIDAVLQALAPAQSKPTRAPVATTDRSRTPAPAPAKPAEKPKADE
jgi:hypothetical protein